MVLLAMASNAGPPGLAITLVIVGSLMPTIIAALMGMIFGPHILALPRPDVVWAGIYGLLAGVLTFVVWALILEVLPDHPVVASLTESGGDIPGAATVVAYLVCLPVLVILAAMVGACAGIMLHQLSFSTLPREE
jgi:hypothetical protein